MIVSGLKSREIHGRIWRTDDIAIAGVPNRYPSLWTSDSLASCSAWNPKRLQNMVLSVGPDTPASLVLTAGKDDDDDESSEFSQSITIVGTNEGNGSDEDENQRNRLVIELSRPSLFRLTRSLGQVNERENEDDEEDDDESNDDDSGEALTASQSDSNLILNHSDQLDDSISTFLGRMKRMRRTHSRENLIGESTNTDIQSASDSYTSTSNTVPAFNRRSTISSHREKRSGCASMKHDGCINTAAWLPCSWRLSIAHTSETFQQGDSLIYSSSFSSNSNEGSIMADSQFHFQDDECPTQIATSGDDRQVKFWDVNTSMSILSPETCFTPFSSSYPDNGIETSVIKRWRKKYNQGQSLPGLVKPLSSIKTGHRGNVFHLTPIPEKPGKVVTCGADGYLLLSDVDLQSSASSSWTASTVVISPRQSDDVRNSLLGIGEMCYSHVMIDANTGLLCSNDGLHQFDLRLPTHSQPPRSIVGSATCKCCALWPISDNFRQTYSTDSMYVFAGGFRPTVDLYDLRYITGSAVIESYTPSKLPDCGNVSVSGIDVSRDKKEILVSYENDVIYSFPILHKIKSTAGPSIDELDERAKASSQSSVSEIACYGAHLNRLTFLKCARYAGPTDEYICTGSDSGHAWIYDKATGTVVSLLKADQTTCNGVIPHPMLPFFITYGIDSTAKLWRATIPVHNEIDDSAIGRCKHLHHRKYEESLVVNDWKTAKANLSMCFNLEKPDLLISADDFPLHDALSESQPFGSFSQFILRTFSHENKWFKIRNDLHSLPLVLSQNLSTCIRAHHDDDDLPIQGSLTNLKHRISLLRIRHQLDELGYSMQPSVSDLEFLIQEAKKYGFQAYESASVIETTNNQAFLPDLIPDHLTDWFPYDPKFSSKPSTFGIKLNKEAYNCRRWKPYKTFKSLRSYEELSNIISSSTQDCSSVMENMTLLLKDYGNMALKQGNVNLAAKYYDKAIRFCSLLFMPCEFGPLEFIGDYQNIILENGGYYNLWTKLFKLFLSIRLNLSAVMMKAVILNLYCSSQQAQLVIDALKPFTTLQGKVLSGPKLECIRADEPVETFIESNIIKAKAYFRLGNAKILMDDYSAAVRSFQNSIKATKAAGLEPETVVLRRLNEARLAKERKNSKESS